MKVSFQTYRYQFLFCLIILSRIFLYVSYAEDIDSLRFALSVIDEFDISKNQPHFPAYPIFAFFVKIIYFVVQNSGLSFAIVGSIGVFLVDYSALEINKIYSWVKEEWLLSLPILLSPLFFLMSTRYMADALGLGVLTISCLWYLKAMKNGSYEKYFFIGAVILAGVRLSFVPLLFVPALILFFNSKNKLSNIGFGLAALASWLIPLIVTTGWNELIDLALFGTNGHFNEWGGSIKTDPHYGLRLLRMFQFVWSDGLGLWWFDRSFTWIPSSLIFVIATYKGFKTTSTKEIKYLIAGFVVYALWAYFYQNVLYKPRHILPLILPFLILFGIGISKLNKPLKNGLLIVFLLSQTYLTFNLARQHQDKNALAKACDYVISQAQENDIVSSNNLIAYFLGQFDAQDLYFLLPSDLPENNTGRIITIGEVLPDKTLIEEKKFYHNPYVNRMWYEVVVRIYE